MYCSVSDANKIIVSFWEGRKINLCKKEEKRGHTNLFEDDETEHYDDMGGGKDMPHANDMEVQADVIYNQDTTCIQSHCEFFELLWYNN